MGERLRSQWRGRDAVHDVVGLIVNGGSVDDMLRSFPDLTRAVRINVPVSLVAVASGVHCLRLAEDSIWKYWPFQL